MFERDIVMKYVIRTSKKGIRYYQKEIIKKIEKIKSDLQKRKEEYIVYDASYRSINFQGIWITEKCYVIEVIQKQEITVIE